MEYDFLMADINIEKLSQMSKTETISCYIDDAEFIIRETQGTINHPTTDNESIVSNHYTRWLYSVYMFLENFDKISAKIIFSSPDGVHTSLNLFKGRLNNPAPNYVFEQRDDGKYYADEAGMRQLQNIVSSLKEKISLLRDVNLKITGGIFSDKDTKKVTFIFYKTGTIKTSLNDEEIKRRKSSLIMRIIKKLRETDSIKIVNLEKQLCCDKSNISRDITKLNEDALVKWSKLKDKIIDTNGNGYFMNKQAYSFFYEDISDFK